MFRTLLALSLLSVPATAQDVASGEETFKKCSACHAVIAPDGTALRKGGKVGPNLYGVVGRQIGAFPEFRYGDSIIAAGADGSVWDEASVAAYLVNPQAWLAEKTADPGARSKMAFKLAEGGADVAAYLASLAP